MENKNIQQQEIQPEQEKKRFNKDIILMVAVIAGLVIVLLVIKHLLKLQ